MKKILIILLLLIFSISMTSCKEEQTNNPPTDTENGIIPNYQGGNMSVPSVGAVDGAIHQFNMTEKDSYIIKDSKTDYKIIVPSEVSISFDSYIAEFLGLFSEATNIQLEIVKDLDYKGDGKYISVGETTLFKNSGIVLDYNQIKSQGYVIKTINDSIYLNGFTDQSCLNAMYQFMTMIADYQYLGPSTYILKTDITDLKLYDFDVIDAPDIEYRIRSYAFVDVDRKYRLNLHNEICIPVNGAHYHNTFNYLDPNIYKKDHPEWYATDDTQLCYTARGDKESLKEMQNLVFEVMKEHLINYPDLPIISFSIQDSNTFCKCDTCTASYNKYNGSNAAVVVQFLNVISDMVNEWFEGEGAPYKRDLKILFFAYLSTNKAPARYDENLKKYVPIDETVVCRENVVPYFCDIRGDYTKSYYDEKSANYEFANSMRAWTECSSSLYFWCYGTNFSHFFVPYNNFDAMVDTYKFAVECDALYLYEQAQVNQQNGSTGWCYLKQYMTSRLAWNCNLDVNQIYDEFFSEFYSKEASSIMRELFDEYHILANYQTNVLGLSGPSSIYQDPYDEKYWPKQTLLKWLDRLDDALEAIEVYKENEPGKYSKYYSHITSERVQYTYLLLTIYNSSLSNEQFEFYRNQFYEDTELNGILYSDELRTQMASELFK